MSTQHITRRVVLKGLGATVALPWLESLGAMAGERPPRTAPPKRFAFMFFGDGIHPAEWWSRGNGAAMELGPAFASLSRIKDKVSFVHGCGIRVKSAICSRRQPSASGCLIARFRRKAFISLSRGMMASG